ncbi:hypothetical protein KXR83_09065 [Williamsia muralis]|uniref:hypothetical protein n=1 Tax=Williamsia marianensis TaxID=85044 RepID=UPI003F13DF4C
MLTTPGEQVERLLREAWPAIDPDMIGRSVERYRVVAQRLFALQSAIEAATAGVADAMEGRTGSALAAKATALADQTARAAHLVGAESDLAGRFSDLVVLTHERLTVAAAMADRDLQAAKVVDVTTGDITAAMGAEHAAATVLAAVAGDFESGSRELADTAAAHAAEHRDSEHGQTTGNAAGAPMIPGAMMGAGSAMAAAGKMRGGDLPAATDVSAADLSMLQTRAAHLSSMQPPEVAPWIRIAVGLGQDHDGRRVVVVGTSEPGGYLRPGTVPEPNEVVVGDGRFPELVIVDYLAARDLVPLAVCATTPPTPEVRSQLADAGVTTSSGDEGNGQGDGQ